MPFINGIWNEPIKQTQEKVKIKASQINLQFTLGRAVGETYRVVYLVQINEKPSMSGLPLQLKNVDMKSLKESIIASIDSFDRDYMKLVKFSTHRATFELDWKKWMNKALQNVRPNNRMSKFEQRFKFKVQIPKMIAYSISRMNFDKFVIRKFKEHMDKNNKTRTWFSKFLPKEISGKIRKKISTMFNYEYDWQTNTIVAKLKSIFVMGILFAVGSLLKGPNKRNYIKIDFEKSVKRKAKRFDRKKWQNFIKKRFI